MDVTSTALECPRGDGRGNPIRIDLYKMIEAESRLAEVAFVTLDKAPELLSTFNKTWLDVQRTVVTLRSEYVKAKEAVRRRKAVMMLDYVEDILKAKGLKSSADLREAVVDADEEYCQAKDREHQLASIISLLEGKMQAFENAYTAIKKLLSTVQLPAQPLRDRGDEETSPESLPFGFGKAQY